MIFEFGYLVLIFVFCLVLVQLSLLLVGVWCGDCQWMSLVCLVVWGQFVFFVFVFGCLIWVFLCDDFLVVYVVGNFNSVLFWYYKFSVVWGVYEGLLLFWVLIFGGWIFVVLIFFW